MDQQHVLAKIRGVQRPGPQSVPAIVWLLSVLLCLTVQLTAFAEETEVSVRVQIAQSTTTVKCADVDNYFAIVQASMPMARPEATASALGFALVPAQGDVRMFARYWFFFNGELTAKRDDDDGRGQKIWDVKPPSQGQLTFKGQVTTFFQDCTAEKEIAAAADLIDKASNNTSITDAIAPFSASGFQFKPGTSSKQDLALSLTNTEQGHAAFSAALRTALRQQNWSATTPTPETPTIVTNGDAKPSPTIDLKKLEEKIDNASRQQFILAAILIGALSLAVLLAAVFVILLFLKPALRRRIFFDPQLATEITKNTVSEMQKLVPPLTEDDYHKGTNGNAETAALRSFIELHFGKKFLKHDIKTGLNELTDQLNHCLLPLPETDSNGSSRTLNRLKSAGEHVQTMWGNYSSKPCPEGALSTLQADWITLQSTFRQFSNDDFKGLLTHARESLELFKYVNEIYRSENVGQNGLKQRIEEFFTDLNNTYRKFADREYVASFSPNERLVDLRIKLQKYDKAAQSAARTVRAVLPEATGEIDEMASALVKKFNYDKDLLSSAEEHKASNEQLKAELETSKTQAGESIQLAGALTRYVHLSTEAQLDHSQVQVILRRFTAGDHIHRQLRLRLSAAIEALDRAVAAVNNAGRRDALAALRIDSFKEPLNQLLTKIEDFSGDTIWKEGLYSGFTLHWLHNLLRAELLARTYFADHDALRLLVDPLTETSTALRSTVHQFNVRIPLLTLLSEPPAEALSRCDVDPKLRDLGEVERKVHARWGQRKPGEDPKFIVDVELFPWQSDSAGDVGQVVEFSSSEWPLKNARG